MNAATTPSTIMTHSFRMGDREVKTLHVVIAVLLMALSGFGISRLQGTVFEWIAKAAMTEAQRKVALLCSRCVFILSGYYIQTTLASLGWGERSDSKKYDGNTLAE